MPKSRRRLQDEWFSFKSKLKRALGGQSQLRSVHPEAVREMLHTFCQDSTTKKTYTSKAAKFFSKIFDRSSVSAEKAKINAIVNTYKLNKSNKRDLIRLKDKWVKVQCDLQDKKTRSPIKFADLKIIETEIERLISYVSKPNKTKQKSPLYIIQTNDLAFAKAVRNLESIPVVTPTKDAGKLRIRRQKQQTTSPLATDTKPITTKHHQRVASSAVIAHVKPRKEKRAHRKLQEEKEKLQISTQAELIALQKLFIWIQTLTTTDENIISQRFNLKRSSSKTFKVDELVVFRDYAEEYLLENADKFTPEMWERCEPYLQLLPKLKEKLNQTKGESQRPNAQKTHEPKFIEHRHIAFNEAVRKSKANQDEIQGHDAPKKDAAITQLYLWIHKTDNKDGVYDLAENLSTEDIKKVVMKYFNNNSGRVTKDGLQQIEKHLWVLYDEKLHAHKKLKDLQPSSEAKEIKSDNLLESIRLFGSTGSLRHVDQPGKQHKPTKK